MLLLQQLVVVKDYGIARGSMDEEIHDAGDFREDASVIEIRHGVYRAKFASPKNGLVRPVAVPPSTATLLRQWMENAVEPKPESFVFAGETGQPLWRSSLLEDYIKAKLEPVGLGWVNFQVMRRTHASLGHHARLIRRFRRTNAATALE